MVTYHSMLTAGAGPARVTTAWILCNLITAQNDATVSIVTTVAEVSITRINQWTIEPNVAASTYTCEWAGIVDAWPSIETHRGIQLTLINVLITVLTCKACITQLKCDTWSDFTINTVTHTQENSTYPTYLLMLYSKLSDFYIILNLNAILFN